MSDQDLTPKAHILVIDDQPTVLNMTRKALELSDYNVSTMQDGVKALALIKNAPPFDLIITDLMVPEISGLDILSNVKQISPDTEVILMTAFGSLETAVEALRFGAHDYLVKPFDISELRHSVEQTLAFRALKLEKAALLANLQTEKDQLRQMLRISNQITQLKPAETLPLKAMVAIIESQLAMAVGISRVVNGHLETTFSANFPPAWQEALSQTHKMAALQADWFKHAQKIRHSYIIKTQSQATSLTLAGSLLHDSNQDPMGVMWLSAPGEKLHETFLTGAELLANHLAAAIENAGLLLAQQRQVNIRNELVQAGHSITVLLDHQEALKNIAHATLQILPQAQMVTLFWVSRQDETLHQFHLNRTGYELTPDIFPAVRITQALAQHQPYHDRVDQLAGPDETPAIAIQPLNVGQESLGVLAVAAHRRTAFDSDDIQILKMLTNQAAIALQNNRLYDEARRVDEMAALVEAGQAINDTLDLRQTLGTTLTMLRNLTGAFVTSIYLYTPELQRIDSVITMGDDIALTEKDRRQSNDLAWQVLHNNEPAVSVTLPDNTTDEAYPSPKDDPAADGEFSIVAWLAVPLAAREEQIGVITLGSTHEHPFTTTDARIVQVIGTQAATAIKNARLYEEAERRLQQNEVLGVITQNISATMNLPRILELMVNSVVKTIPAASHCTFYILDKLQQAFTVQAHAAQHSGPLPQDHHTLRTTLVEQARETGEVCHQDIALQAESPPNWSIMVVPLRIRNEMIAAIVTESPSASAFAPSDEKIITTFASHASVAIQNANLFRELSTAYVNMASQKEALLRSNHTLQALFDGITDSLYILDPHLTILAINKTEVTRLNQTAEDLIGAVGDEELWGNVASAVGAIVQDTVQTGETHTWDSAQQHYGSLAVPHRGVFTDRDINTYPIFAGDGSVQQVILFAQDVSEKKQLQASLFQSANLVAVGQLASSIAHEINNPLTVIIANSQVLQMETEPNNPVHESISYILNAGQRIQHIVQNLLDFSTQESYEWFETSIADTIEDALMLVAAPLRKNKIEVVTNLPSLPVVMASENHLKLLWMNLLLNAKDAIAGTEETGKITITGEQIDVERVAITVIDNGTGVAPQHQERLFHPFFTTKAPGQGPGLGLYTARNIAQKHGGDIALVNNKQGHGVTVTVTLSVAGLT